MELLHTTKNLSLTMLGLGMMASAHATTISCNQEFKTDGEIVAVENSIECNTTNAPNGYAVLISGNDIHFLLNDFSITAEVGDEPVRGISITGDGNYVMGPGTVEGFSANNIIIQNAVNNHVSGLTLKGGTNSIILTAVDNESVRENYIYHNSIQDPVNDGIKVLSIASNSATASADANQIHDNSLQGIMAEGDGISVGSLSFGDATASADANQIHDNHIQDIGAIGISVRSSSSSGATASTDANQIHDNHIQNTGSTGILVSSSASSDSTASADANQIILNHIIRPGAQAIVLEREEDSSTTHNVITYNFTENPQATPVYCDNTEQVNLWQINFIDLVPQFFNPGSC